MNIPQLFTLPDFSLDDAAVDSEENVYVTDSINCSVYKFAPNAVPVGTFSVNCSPDTDATVMNLAVDSRSNFYVSDAVNGLILKYSDDGRQTGDYWTPGVITLCSNIHGSIYVLSESAGIERIDCYDPEGNLVDVLSAPARGVKIEDASLLNMDVDAQGNVYLSDGLPPYRIWKIRADGTGTDVLTRHLDHPEDTILIADIGIDSTTGNIYALLALKHRGQQMVDVFSPQGEFIETLGVPHSVMMYSVISPAGDSFYFLNTSTGPGSGDLMLASYDSK